MVSWQPITWRREYSQLLKRRVYEIYLRQWSMLNTAFLQWINHCHKPLDNRHCILIYIYIYTHAHKQTKYQYHYNQSPEDGSTANSRNVVYIKYTSDNKQCPKYCSFDETVALKTSIISQLTTWVSGGGGSLHLTEASDVSETLTAETVNRQMHLRNYRTRCYNTARILIHVQFTGDWSKVDIE
jgi:hypothetical protein